MKLSAKLLGAILVLGSTSMLPAQDPAPEPLIAAAARFDASQLDQLLGPIALYPDALIALILPASAASSDVVLAARYLRDGGDAAEAENQPWDESVRALLHYPEVVKWMDENLAWTKQLGEAFVAQPAEIMSAVQRLRAKAQSVGTLTSTPQQQVVVEQSTISIVPTEPDVIYVPYYDPAVVYVPHPAYFTSPFVYFGAAYATGYWLSYNVDWSARRVCHVNYHNRQHYWNAYPDFWRRPYFSNRPGYVASPYNTWAPRSRSAYASRQNTPPRAPTQVFRPGPVNTVTNTGSRWRGYDDARRAPNGPRADSSVSTANALPQAAFARSTSGRTHAASHASTSQPSLANPLPQPLPNPLSAPLANPLPQPMPSPLPHVQDPTAAPHTGSWARPSGEHRDRGNSQRHPDAATTPVGPQSFAPRAATASSFAPRPATASSFAPHAASAPVQAAPSPSPSPRFQAAPAPRGPAIAAPPTSQPAPAAAPQAAPQYQAPAAPNSSRPSAASNAGQVTRGSSDGGNGSYRGRDRVGR